jgi:hypothetical protein
VHTGNPAAAAYKNFAVFPSTSAISACTGSRRLLLLPLLALNSSLQPLLLLLLLLLLPLPGLCRKASGDGVAPTAAVAAAGSGRSCRITPPS